MTNPLLRPFLTQVARYWWVELLVGVLWVVIAVVVLKFNNASVVTVGLLTGIMFLLFAAVGIVGLVILQATPYPTWMRVEQLLQAVILAALLWFVLRPGVRAHFATVNSAHNVRCPMSGT